MDSVFHNDEIITLILGFYTDTKGYWKITLSEHHEVEKFIKLKYAELDETFEKYVLNSKGEQFLHNHIEQITKDLISYININDNMREIDDISTWFAQKFNLNNTETIQRISQYIINNSINYGYELTKIHLNNKGFFYRVEIHD